MHSSTHVASRVPRGRLAPHHQPPPLRFLPPIGEAPGMSNKFRVLNISTGATCKYKQAKHKVEQECVWAWVDDTQRQVRNRTVGEMVTAVAVRNKTKRPLCFPEIRGVTWEPPIAERSYTFLDNRRALLAEARQFAAQAIAQL
jgi:hypothetical protein